jgi:chromosome segregation ATPase
MTETTAHDKLRNLSTARLFTSEQISELRQEFYGVLRALSAVALQNEALEEELADDIIDLEQNLGQAREERDVAIVNLHKLDRTLAKEQEELIRIKALYMDISRAHEDLYTKLKTAETLNFTLHTEKNEVRALLDECGRMRDLFKQERDNEIDAHVVTIKTLNSQRIGDQELVASEAKRLYIEHEYKKLGEANDAYIKLIDKYERQTLDYSEKVTYIADLADARLTEIYALKRDLAAMTSTNQAQYDRILMLEGNVSSLNHDLRVALFTNKEREALVRLKSAVHDIDTILKGS